MGRFLDNPFKTPLAGNEGLAAEDPSNDQDICVSPIAITQFAQQNMGLATGSTQGLISGAQADKLAALPSASSLAGQVTQLAEVAIPVFVSTPSDGSINIYQHVCDTPWELDFAYAALSAGSTNVTITKNNANIAGFTNGGATTAGQTFIGTDSPANMTFNQGDVLGVTLVGTTGNAANFRLSIRANAAITP